jgi:hypothetical protein
MPHFGTFAWCEGHYQFRSIATDNAGNVEAAPTSPDFDAGYGYDATAPSSPTLLSPASGTSTTNHQPTLDWSTSTDGANGSGERPARDSHLTSRLISGQNN